MATLGATFPTFADWLTRRNPDMSMAAVIELLATMNPILKDAAVLEGNLPTGHRSTQRTGIPAGTFRQINGGVDAEKSTTQQVNDTCGMLESYAEVDCALAALNGNTAEWRASEVQPFLDGMSRTMATTVFYGNVATDPEKFTGLAPRFNSLTSTVQSSGQIVDGGGTQSDNSSIWFVTWGPQTAHFIFPKGGTPGLQHRDLGEATLVIDTTAKKLQVYRDHFKWSLGLTVKDWRYVSRICNIDASDISATGAAGPGGASYTGPNLPNLMIRAMHKLYSLGSGNLVIYCNRTVSTALDLIAANKTNVWLDVRQYAGEMVTHFRGIPIRVCDAITDTEARIT